jgi:uncharacterized protein (DUF885 family)
MKKLLLLALALSLLPACNTAKREPLASGPGTSSRSPAEVFASYHEERLKLYPLEATFAGDNRYNDSLPNVLTDSWRTEAEAFYRKYLAALGQYEGRSLSPEDQMSRDILKWECEVNLAQLRFPTHLLPIDQFNSLNALHLQFGQWAIGTSAQPFKTVKDYDNWLKRLDGFTAWCHTAVTNMRTGMARGYVLPKALTQKVIPQMADLAKGPVEDHLFYTPIKNMPAEFSSDNRARLTRAYAAMVGEKIIPAFRNLEEFLTNEYLLASRRSSGISGIPKGKEYYALQIKIYTTTDMSAEDVFQLGQQEVKRLSAEMEGVKRAVGFQGSLKEFFVNVRTRKELMPLSEPQQVIDHFNAIHRKMQPSLKRLFNLVPKTAFEVRRTEAFREASASAEYIQGSIDGSRPGIFYVPIRDVAKYNILSDEDLFLHEAIPGHHYQISLQQENARLPQFRRTLWYNAYGEGWALYSESLGKELGLYDDPYQYFGMLSAEMHRAIRLVVDTGLHAKGWTREQAIQYSLDHEAAPESSIVAEIERYMAWPGQALSYKVGQLKIRALRARAEKQLGARFDIREFHDQLLESGCLPLKLLEQKIDRWIREKRGA